MNLDDATRARLDEIDADLRAGRWACEDGMGTIEWLLDALLAERAQTAPVLAHLEWAIGALDRLTSGSPESDKWVQTGAAFGARVDECRAAVRVARGE